MVETAKRILTKEKLDRQLNGQSLSTTFMSTRGDHKTKASLDTKEKLGDKIDKLEVTIDKLATREIGTGIQFKPQIHQSRGKGQNINYNQSNYQNRYRSNNRSNSGDRGQYRQDRGRLTYKQNYRRGNFRGNVRRYGRQKSRGEYRNSYRNDSYDRSRNRPRERSFSRYHGNNPRNQSTTVVGPGQDQEEVQIWIEFNVISVGNMIISQGTLPLLEMKKK